MLHFCQDCIVDWYNESDIRGSVTVTLSEREDPGARGFRGWLPSPSDDASGDKIHAMIELQLEQWFLQCVIG